MVLAAAAVVRVTADMLLARLDKVKSTGPGRWIARCPAHEDRSPSLSIREIDDGRILVHDFAGCDVESVVAAVGLTLEALMPPRAIDNHVKRERRPFFPSDVFEIALREITIAAVTACDLHKNRTVDEVDYQRLLTACGRLNDIAGAAYGR